MSPQTLSVAEDSPYEKEAVAFIDFLLRPPNMVRLARGDWMLPTGTTALAHPSLHTAEHGWATGTALAKHLRPAPAQTVRGYPEWKDKVATPPSRSTTAARSTPLSCADGWSTTATGSWPATSAERLGADADQPRATAPEGNAKIARRDVPSRLW